MSRAAGAVETVPLSTDRIISTAAAMIEADGVAGFSMRQLAGRLGVTAMALYRWFDNRDALLDAVVDRAMTDLVLPAADEGPWEDRVLALAAAVRTHLLGHRHLLAIPSAAQRITTSMFLSADRGLDLMAEIGLDGAEAVAAYRCVFWHTVAFTTVVDESGIGPVRAPTIPTGAAPTLARHLDHFATFDADALFTQSTRAMITGLART